MVLRDLGGVTGLGGSRTGGGTGSGAELAGLLQWDWGSSGTELVGLLQRDWWSSGTELVGLVQRDWGSGGTSPAGLGGTAGLNWRDSSARCRGR